jgi:hypothetical protein
MYGLPIGGQQEQTGGHDIQSPYVRQPCGIPDQIEDGTATRLIISGRHDPERLVQREPPPRDELHGAAIDGDALVGRIDLGSELGDLAVDPHPSLANQVFGRPPGGHTCASQGPLEPHFSHASAST